MIFSFLSILHLFTSFWIRHLYKHTMYTQLTLNNGARTEEPASANSNAVNSCGKILFLQNDGGNVSSDGVSLLKNASFSDFSLI